LAVYGVSSSINLLDLSKRPDLSCPFS